MSGAGAALGRTTRGIPVTAMWGLAILGGTLAMLPGINELLALGSVTFLAVFASVNYASARTAEGIRERVLGFTGAVACAASIVIVAVDLVRTDRLAVGLIVGDAALLLLLRAPFVRRRGAPGAGGAGGASSHHGPGSRH